MIDTLATMPRDGALRLAIESAVTFAIEQWPQVPACATSEDPDAWFPDEGADTLEAEQACGACPFRVECLQGALERGERYGVWGGVRMVERRAPRVSSSPHPGVAVTKSGRYRVDARRGGEHLTGTYADEATAASVVQEWLAARPLRRKKERCRKGHWMTEENTRVHSDGRPRCRACTSIGSQASKARLRAAKAA